MSKPLIDYIDDHGMITKVHSNPQWFDGGDSAHRWGYFHSGLKFHEFYGITVEPEYTDGPNSFEDGLCELHNGWGLLRRHPDTKCWYGDFDRFSRDQYFPILIAMVLSKSWSVLTKAFLNHLFLRGMVFMTNIRENGATLENHGEVLTDGRVRSYKKKVPGFTGPETWSCYFRGLPKWISIWGYPLYWISDIMTLVNGVGRNNDKDKDVLNFVLLAVNANMNWPTSVHKKMLKEVNWKLMEEKMEKYFDDTEPPLHKIWVPIIKELAKQGEYNGK